MGEHDESGEEPWPFYRRTRGYPRPGRTSREEAREQRIAGHVQQRRERGARRPGHDRGLSLAERRLAERPGNLAFFLRSLRSKK